MNRWSKEDLEPQVCIAAAIHGTGNQEFLVQWHKKLRKWSLPMGKTAPGKNPLRELKREIKEECGINITKAILADKRNFIATRNGRKMKVPVYVYEVLSYTGEIKNLESDKHPIQKFIDLRTLIKSNKPRAYSLQMWMESWFGKNNLK